MSKLSFRARALDASKPLPVFRCEDLPDLHEYASINRAVPQMPTGMEKEEESVCFNRKMLLKKTTLVLFIFILKWSVVVGFFFSLCASYHKMAAGFSQEKHDGLCRQRPRTRHSGPTVGRGGHAPCRYRIKSPGFAGLFVREVVF